MKVFETELKGIKGVESPEPIAEESSESEKGKVRNVVGAAISSGLAGVTDTIKTMMSDNDGDGQEHNEL